ncbi:MAG: hypothetical protein KGQ57_17010 [Burkholderiales bacterium]|nr:hypothetical protein [Burkholderiales bacterium]
MLTGDGARDVAAIRQAAGGGVDLAFDMVGHATDAGATLAAIDRAGAAQGLQCTVVAAEGERAWG